MIKQPGTANTQDVDVSVPSGVSLPGENAAKEVTHSLSRGSSLSSGSFLPLCTLCRKERYQLIRHGRRPPARQKGFKMPECVLGIGFVNQFTEELMAEEIAPSSLCSKKGNYKNKTLRLQKSY